MAINKEKLGEAVLELRTTLGAFEKELNVAHTKAKGFTADLAAVGTKLTSVGKSFTKALTLPIMLMGVAAIKMSADFEKSMSEIIGLVGVAKTQVNAWKDDLLNMSKSLGRAPKELADAMFFITSAGLRGKVAMQTLEASTKAAIAGLGETKVIADAATSAINAYGQENISAAEAVDVLVATVREGKAAADAIAGAIGRVIPLASQMGITFDQVGGVIAALTRIGFSADEAATSLQAVMTAMLKPTMQAEDALKKYGLTARGLRDQIKKKGLLSALTLLNERLGGNSALLAEIFPNVRALRGALGLLGENAEETARIMDSLADSTGATDFAFEEASDTIKQRFAVVLAKIQAAFIELGDAIRPILIPILNKVGDLIEKLSNWFKGLTDNMKQTIIKVAAMVAAIGPLLIVIGALIKAFIAIKAAVIAFSLALSASPIGLIALAVAGLAAVMLVLARNTKRANEELANSEIKNLVLPSGGDALRNELLDFSSGSSPSTKAGFESGNSATAATTAKAAASSWTQLNKMTLETLQVEFRRIEAEKEMAELLHESYDEAKEKAEAVRLQISNLLNEVDKNGERVYSLTDKTISGMSLAIEKLLDGQQGSIENTEDLRDIANDFYEVTEKTFEEMLQDLADIEKQEQELHDKRLAWLQNEWDNSVYGAIAGNATPAESNVEVPVDILAGVLDTLLNALGGTAGELASLAVSAGWVGLLLFAIGKIFESMMVILGPLVDNVLAPLMGILMVLGTFLGNVLAPIFIWLAPIIKVLGDVFVWLYNLVFVPIGNLLIGVFSVVGIIVGGFVNILISLMNVIIEIVNVFKRKEKQLALIELLEIKGLEDTKWLENITPEDLIDAGLDGLAPTDGSSGSSGGATFQQARPIDVTIDVHDNDVYGGNLRDFAIILREEFEELDQIGL